MLPTCNSLSRVQHQTWHNTVEFGCGTKPAVWEADVMDMLLAHNSQLVQGTQLVPKTPAVLA